MFVDSDYWSERENIENFDNSHKLPGLKGISYNTNAHRWMSNNDDKQDNQ